MRNPTLPIMQHLSLRASSLYRRLLAGNVIPQVPTETTPNDTVRVIILLLLTSKQSLMWREIFSPCLNDLCVPMSFVVSCLLFSCTKIPQVSPHSHWQSHSKHTRVILWCYHHPPSLWSPAVPIWQLVLPNQERVWREHLWLRNLVVIRLLLLLYIWFITCCIIALHLL